VSNTAQQMEDELQLRRTAKALYHEVIRTSNMFLHNCKHFSIDFLRNEDPSYSELAELMRELTKLITAFADGYDPMMGQQASEYCDLMEQMSVAIEEGNRVRLALLIADLERKPGL
jgi:hypothetical protein